MGRFLFSKQLEHGGIKETERMKMMTRLHLTEGMCLRHNVTGTVRRELNSLVRLECRSNDSSAFTILTHYNA